MGGVTGDVLGGVFTGGLYNTGKWATGGYNPNGADSTLTIKTDTPITPGSSTPSALEQIDRENRKRLGETNSGLASPDFTDEALLKARKAAALSLSAMQGRKQSFLAGPGDGVVPPVSRLKLGGY